MAVQWLRLHVSNAKDMGSIPGQGAKIPHRHSTAKNDKKIKSKINKMKAWYAMFILKFLKIKNK